MVVSVVVVGMFCVYLDLVVFLCVNDSMVLGVVVVVK